MKFNENEQSKKNANQLGRVYAVYETLRKKAINQELSGTVFGNFMQNPCRILTILSTASQNHLSMLKDNNIRTFYKKMICELYSDITDIPVKFDLNEKGEFITGYYTQRYNMEKHLE